ncbi:MAG: hypothetical protein DSM106950_29320 [Stigonema ocellatum SAG 48.90 = DSM 106950]|nr:hypothetical protein [Stigonema ocellatum SAG 48.90 = DSM 106950]
MADSSSNNRIGSSGDSTNALKDSPWGRLSEVTSLDNVAQGFGSATAGNGGGGSPVGGAGGGATSDAPYGGNPFANFGNPNAAGNVFTGGTNPWASLGNSGGGSQAGGGQASGGGSQGASGSIDYASVFGGSATSGSPVGGTQANGGGSQAGGTQANGSGSPVGDGSIDFASVFGGGSGGNVPQQSPFDTLQTNLDNYFKPFQEGVTPDASQFGDPSKLNPFADATGGSQSSNGSPVGGGSDSLTSGGVSGYNGGSNASSYSNLPSGLQDVFAGLGSGDSQSSPNGFDPSQIPNLQQQFGGGSGNQIGGNPFGGGNNPFG